MIPTDRAHFAAAMTRLFAIYGDELTDTLLDAWWGVLAGYDLRDVRWAMNAHATDPDKGRYRPTPADIIRHITESLPAHRAKLRNDRIRLAREKMEPLERELYQLRADLEHGLIPEADQPAARARLNGLSMQIGALTREAGIDDRPRITKAPEGARTIARVLRQLEDGNGDGYWCVVCGRFLPASGGVVVHDDVPHPDNMSFDDGDNPQ